MPTPARIEITFKKGGKLALVLSPLSSDFRAYEPILISDLADIKLLINEIKEVYQERGSLETGKSRCLSSRISLVSEPCHRKKCCIFSGTDLKEGIKIVFTKTDPSHCSDQEWDQSSYVFTHQSLLNFLSNPDVSSIRDQ